MRSSVRAFDGIGVTVAEAAVEGATESDEAECLACSSAPIILHEPGEESITIGSSGSLDGHTVDRSIILGAHALADIEILWFRIIGTFVRRDKDLRATSISRSGQPDWPDWRCCS